MFSTPAGSPASIAISASRYESSAVSGDGFTTTAHPATSAGAILLTVMNCGTFHATIPAATPTGSLRTSVGPSMPCRSSSHGYSAASPRK